MTKKLNLTNLNSFSEKVKIPTYSREELTPGIVHIGLGNFHRAHQAVYLDDLFNTGTDHDWGIIGAGIKPYDEAMRKKLAAQDWLSTIVELDPKGLTARISGSMIGFLDVNPGALIEAMCQPNIRIVSMTITEGGYYMDARTGGFNKNHPDILAEVANPSEPKTVFGILIQALIKRREAGIAPFTIMSCDNLPENGYVAKQTVVGLATEISPDLGAWIADNVALPNSMVDCITPATTDRERNI
ncbi:MAG: mannitol dehydrogenase, partial [Hyphomicrobiales bacterium]